MRLQKRWDFNVLSLLDLLTLNTIISIMKIKFSDTEIFDVIDVQYLLDKEGIPVDIVISAWDVKTLEKIAETAGCLGFNTRESEICSLEGVITVAEALFGRLRPFVVTEFTYGKSELVDKSLGICYRKTWYTY